MGPHISTDTFTKIKNKCFFSTNWELYYSHSNYYSQVYTLTVAFTHLFYAENVYDNIKHQFFQQSIAIIADQKEHFWIYRQWIPIFFFFFFTRLITPKKRNAEEEISNIWKQKRNSGIDMDYFLLPFPWNVKVKLKIYYCLLFFFNVLKVTLEEKCRSKKLWRECREFFHKSRIIQHKYMTLINK